jgi:tetratricopeptide (TPR) repeat protein
MGLFDRLVRRSRSTAIENPEELRVALFRAIESKDNGKFKGLCRNNYSSIVSNFPMWRKSPANLMGDKGETYRYGSAIVVIAEFFEESFGDRTLINILSGAAGDNPLIRWHNAISRAKNLMGDGEFPEATSVLENAIIDASGLVGPGAEEAHSHSWGNLGVCYYRLGRFEEALIQTERALAYCQSTHDLEGTKTYLGNLVNVLTKLDRSEDAAKRSHELIAVEEALTHGSKKHV